ncbi:hypothetical protein BDV06DRAFT_226372 [Aspergillus oleicola]
MTLVALFAVISPVLAISILIYDITLIVHRLYLSPLSKFPGSRLAASTSWYGFYFDYWQNGQYIFEIERMHQFDKTSAIIRINSDELSIHDPDFYNEVYVTETKRRTNNYDVFCKGIDFDASTLILPYSRSHLLTVDHTLHRKRRKPLEPVSSRMNIQALQSMLTGATRKLEQRLRALAGTGTVVRLDHACAAFSGDIIAKICLDDAAEGQRYLDDPEFSPYWYASREPRESTYEVPWPV